MSEIKDYVDLTLATLTLVFGFALFGHACATQHHVSHYQITNGNPTYVMGTWYQCKPVEVKK